MYAPIPGPYKMKRLPLLSLLILTGCANSHVAMRDAGQVERGMSKAQVERIMGAVTADKGAASGPQRKTLFKKETLRGADGQSYDVLYYYTPALGAGLIEAKLTPVVFQENRVIGIGWGFLDGITSDSPPTIKRR